MPEVLYGGIEAGGTKFVCAVGDGTDRLIERRNFPTTLPEETLQRAIDFFQPFSGRLKALGVGSFGPIDPNPSSPTYGHITSTPKKGWAETEFGPRLERDLGIPVGFDTDVNAAAMGEHLWGSARNLDTFIYLTVGTGVGGGGFARGKRLRGLVHPEMGHLMLPAAKGDDFRGACPFHGNCLEGMVSGPALEARTGCAAEQLPDDHPVWTYTAHYLAAALVNYICVLSPQRIVMGGGVMKRSHLFTAVRARVREYLNGYVQVDQILSATETYIVPPALGEHSGVVGALALAAEAAADARASIQ